MHWQDAASERERERKRDWLVMAPRARERTRDALVGCHEQERKRALGFVGGGDMSMRSTSVLRPTPPNVELLGCSVVVVTFRSRSGLVKKAEP